MAFSSLSTKVTKKITARINDLLDEGLGDNQICRIIRREATEKGTWPELTNKQVRDMIYEIAEQDDSDSEWNPSEASSDASSEASSDSEWEYHSDASAESSDTEEPHITIDAASETSSETSSDTDSTKSIHTIHTVYFFLDNKDSDTIDRVKIVPNKEGRFDVEMAYDLTYSYNYPDRATFFEGTADEVYEYIASLQRLLAIDELPYYSVEVAIPFFPSIRVRPGSLKKKVVRSQILGALAQFLGHYATA